MSIPSSESASVGPTTSRYAFLAGLLAQIGLIGLMLQTLDILQPTFRYVAYLAFCVFPIYFFVVRQWRVTIFVALSLAATLLVLGSTLDVERLATWSLSLALLRGGVLVATGVAIIALCRLKIGFSARVCILVLAGAAVALARQGLALGRLELDVVWIVLASMFMFRTMVYLYETSTSSAPATWRQSLAYFFMLPNAGSVLFPVVDFNTFVRSHDADRDLSIYQRGIQRMLRGLLHLLMYRYVAQVFMIPVTSVDGGKSLLVFVVTNSLMYLNVSGQFHFITGLILLFGFDLPETNRRYFLASSFSDYWRRVNIYWKDFILRVFYYPAFFKLKGLGNRTALVAATVWSFVVTWALHLYQTWWLTGRATLTLPDVLFWSILGGLIVVNSLWEARNTRDRRSPGQKPRPWRDALLLGAQTAATCASVSVLWSLWSSPSLDSWLRAWSHANRDTAYGAIVVLLGVMVAKVAIEARPWIGRRSIAPPNAMRPAALWRIAGTCAATVGLVLVTSQMILHTRWLTGGLEHIDARWTLRHVVDVLEAGDSLIPQDEAEQLDYYRRLSTLDEGNRQLLEVMIRRFIPTAPKISTPPIENTPDFPFEWMKPMADGPSNETSIFQTNRWGMRDEDYAAAKPPGVIRIALLGSSHTMGYAVAREEDFEARLEHALNGRARDLSPHAPAIQILNFAQAGFSPLDQVAVLQKRIRMFSPDIVLFVAHLEDFNSTNYRLRRALRKGTIPFSFVNQLLDDIHVDPLTIDGLAERRIRPREPTLVRWAYSQLVDEARAMGALATYFLMPAPGWELPLTFRRAEQADALVRLARDAGFDVIDGRHTFDGYEPDALFTGISPHSNVLAHRLIADALLTDLERDERIARLLDVGPRP